MNCTSCQKEMKTGHAVLICAECREDAETTQKVALEFIVKVASRSMRTNLRAFTAIKSLLEVLPHSDLIEQAEKALNACICATSSSLYVVTSGKEGSMMDAEQGELSLDTKEESG